VTGPPLQLQNATVVSNLLSQLGIDISGIRFDVIPAVLPVAVIDAVDKLKVDRLAWGSHNQTAVAAQNATLQLFNPTNSGKVIHADSVIVSATAAAVIRIRQFDTPLTTADTALGFRDRRLDGSPVAQIRRQSPASLLGVNRGEVGVSVAEDAELVPLDSYLEAGNGLLVVPEAVQIGVRAFWFWEEIPV